MSDEIPYSKKGQRKVSAFVGQELLYDYMTGALDSDRKKAVEDYLHSNREAYSDIQKIQHGMNYVEMLGATQVSEALLEKIKMPTSYLQGLLQKIDFDEWSPGFKLAIEASVVALGVVAIAILMPWNRMTIFRGDSKDMVLSELSKKYDTKSNSEKEAVFKDDTTFPDEESGDHSETSVVAVTSSSTTTSLVVAKSPTEKSAKENNAAAVPPIPPADEDKTTAADSKRQGFLYRGSIEITNVQAVTPKLVDKVSELGGRKAGNVELGWSRGSGAYFHLTIPELKYEELKAAFSQYGELKITKEKHDRVMPEGIIRIIITVEEKK